MSTSRITKLDLLIQQAFDNGISCEEITESVLDDLVNMTLEEFPYFTKEQAKEHAIQFLRKKMISTEQNKECNPKH